MNSKDEDILINCLRLIMTLIAQKAGETNQIGRTLAEENGNQLIKKLISLIKEGPNINYCHFTKQVYFMCISLLRAFIQHSVSTKQLIMNDRGSGKYPTAVKQVIVELLHPRNLHLIDHNTENAILSLLTQIVRDEIEYKRVIGHMFIPQIGERLRELIRYVQYKDR
jgi:hypothetical protein